MAGEVIGINSVKVASVGIEGMSYAIASTAPVPW
jgi:S1-C subfamily serine protease